MARIYRFGACSLDSVNQTLTRQGVSATLRPKQFAVLDYLIRNPGRLVTKDELLDAAWPDVAVGDGVLKACIAEIRKLLDDNASPPDYIETVHRRGYKFVAVVRTDERPEAEPGISSNASDLPAVNQTSPDTINPKAERIPNLSGTGARPRGKSDSRSLLLAGAAVLLTGLAASLLMPSPMPRLTGSTQITHDGIELCCLTTDGSRIYFNRLSSLNQDTIAEVSLTGGLVLEIPTTLKNSRIMDISLDRNQLLVGAFTDAAETGSLWTIDLPAGSTRRVGNFTTKGNFYATWSPDGKKLVFSKGSELWISNADSSDASRIATVNGIPGNIAFSPDGKRLRFTLSNLDRHTFELWEVRPDGSDLHALLPGWQATPHECCGIWTHDGRYYLFRTNSSSDDFGEIYAIREPHGLFHKKLTPIQLTFGPTAFSIGAMAPNDRKLLVAGLDQRGQLVRYDSVSRQFVPFLAGIPATEVAFSRDRSRIAYVSIADSTLWTSRTDGTERTQLTFAPDHAGLPRWSPDGTQITYVSARLGRPWKAMVISAQGGTGETLVPGGGTESDPSWSPDGGQIVFSTGNAVASQNSEIKLFDVKNHRISTIPGSEGRFSARWSPDGRYLAALDLGAVSKKISLYEFRTGRWTDWVFDDGGIEYPAWTAKGDYIVYTNPQKCRRVKLGGSQPEDLFVLDKFTPFFSDFGPWSDNASDDSRIFTRDVSTEDIYALDLDLP